MSTDSQQQQQHDYRPMTLNSTNIDRCTYLPCFPYSQSPSSPIPLLLANVSTRMLSVHDLNRRYGHYYDGPFIPCIMNNQLPSYLKEYFQCYFHDLIERLRINMSLIDFNLLRLQHLLQRWQSIQKILTRRSNQKTKSSLLQQKQVMDKLDEHELAMVLEFFLQIDVDLFYMKTCSFREAQPRSFDEGLFCKADLPDIRYGLQPCLQLTCSLCLPSTSMINMPFHLYQIHRFLNGYHAILNCPATCQTNNIIYALTCPCGEYDFIGSTSSNLSTLIPWIREQNHQYIHESLVTNNSNPSLMDHEDRRDYQRLNQHARHCPKILQLFLDQNPHYHCFIPSPIDSSTIDHVLEIDQGRPPPQPPLGYTFSLRQQQQQEVFFQQYLSSTRPSWTAIDLYQPTIIAVLPDTCSTLARRIIESLFATHAETKLNMFSLCHINMTQIYGPPYQGLWCEKLIRPMDILN